MTLPLNGGTFKTMVTSKKYLKYVHLILCKTIEKMINRDLILCSIKKKKKLLKAHVCCQVSGERHTKLKP